MPGRQLFIDTAPLRQFAANLNALDTAAYSVQQRPSGSIAVASEGTPRDTLDQLSALTGGRVFPTDTTEDATGQAESNAERMNYRMAFSPDRLDGKYHKIRITVARKDIKIQTAERYYAIAAPDAGRREEAIENTIGQSPFDYPGIGLAATAAPVEGAPGEFRLSIFLDAADVALLKEGTRYKANVATALVEFGSHGQRTISRGEPLNLDMSEEDYAKALKAGIQIKWQAKIDPSTQQVRVIALDRVSNLVGSVTMPVNPNP
jgi:hypothetical protein